MEKLRSRKLIVSVCVAILIIVNDKFSLGISEEAMFSAAGLIAAYVVGQGIADASEKKSSEEIK